MKIGHFITLFPYPESMRDSNLYKSYPVGGAEIGAYKVACNMAKLGHDVTVFTTSADSKNHVEEANSVKVYRYGTNLRIEKVLFSFDLQFRPNKQDVDIVHLHFTTPPGNLAGFYYAKVKKKPLVITYHGDADPSYGRLIRRVGLWALDTLIVDRILSTARLIIAPSEYYINQSHFLPKYREKAIAIPYGIDPEEIEVPDTKEECRNRLSLSIEDKIILFVGALINFKSPNLLIEALPLIIEKISEARLVLVGDGPMRGELEILAERLGISDKVKLIGNVVGESKALYYKAADVFTFPSTGRTESFGIVLLEAAAAGLPIVVSSLDTFRAFVEHGYSGVVTELGNIDSLATAIIDILSNPDFGERIGRNARNKLKDFTWGMVARKTEEVYEMAMTRKQVK